MVLAGLDAEHSLELAAVLVCVLALAALAIAPAQRRREAALAQQAARPALARFVDAPLTDPADFGGGAATAHVQRRRDTVAYGYLAVAEEFVAATGERWCTLTVTLPGRVPFLVVDERRAHGRPHVPMDAPHRAPLGDPAFDAAYGAGAEELSLLGRVLTPQARDRLLAHRVQRLMLRESSVQLRTPDGTALDAATVAGLVRCAEEFLASTPSFLRSSRAAAGVPTPAAGGDAPLHPGLHGQG